MRLILFGSCNYGYAGFRKSYKPYKPLITSGLFSIFN
nr:MAG TPA_asm: hypothetical protein [Caudoviricetes sp.]